MKSFWNFLKKNKLYGAINLVGLTVSMAFVLLLAVYVQRQLTTDSFQKNSDRIYVIANEDNVTMGYWLDKHLKNNFPEIEKGWWLRLMLLPLEESWYMAARWLRTVPSLRCSAMT